MSYISEKVIQSKFVKLLANSATFARKEVVTVNPVILKSSFVSPEISNQFTPSVVLCHW
ncbi:hypothetical protein [Winogradskyella sp.]|uniref:hypothetical protein n=1 Tax=Winogradskyella sp. TaxID=1883156 RepID=UPI003F6967BA